MKHLDDKQFADAIEGTQDPAAASHLAGCGACGARVEELRSVMSEVRDDEIADPSPLFWDHFGVRVNAAIDAAPSRRFAWLTPPRRALAVIAIVVIAIGVALSPRGFPERSDGPAVRTTAGTTPVTGTGALPDDVEADEGWAAMQDAGVLPDSQEVERAAMELTDDERAELARLIEAELKRTGP